MDFEQHFTLSYTGKKAEDHMIDPYDASRAIMGFHKSLALTTHLVLHGEVIDRVSSLKGAEIYISPPEKGSWEIVAVITAGLFAAGTAPKNTPLGHLVHSAYDYVLSKILGIHADYDQTIGQLIQRRDLAMLRENVSQKKLDELADKIGPSISEIHNPIIKTNTAAEATIGVEGENFSKIMEKRLDAKSHDDLEKIVGAKEIPFIIEGPVKTWVSVYKYDSNNQEGKARLSGEKRQIAFELDLDCMHNNKIALIIESLSANASVGHTTKLRRIFCSAYRVCAPNGRLKKLIILDVARDEASLPPAKHPPCS